MVERRNLTFLLGDEGREGGDGEGAGSCESCGRMSLDYGCERINGKGRVEGNRGEGRLIWMCN